jgi:hypothetical protein
VLKLDPSNVNARFDLFKLEASRRNFQQSLDVAAPILPQLFRSDEALVALASDYGALGKMQDLENLIAHHTSGLRDEATSHHRIGGAGAEAGKPSATRH